MQTIWKVLQDAVERGDGWNEEIQITHLVGFLQDLVDHPGLTPGGLIPEMLGEYLDSVIAEEIGF